MTEVRAIGAGIDLTRGDRLVAAIDDLAPACRAALDRAAWLARSFGASLNLLASLDVDAAAESLIRKQHQVTGDSLIDSARRALDELAATVRTERLPVTTEVAFGNAAGAILDDAARHGRDVVVVGSAPRGARSRRRAALQLLRHCPVPVWIARPESVGRVRRVLGAVGYEETAADVVDFAAAVASVSGAPLHLLHVAEDASARILRIGGASDDALRAYEEAGRAPADAALRRLVSRASTAGVAARPHRRSGDPAEEIAAAARELEADVVVVGSHAHGALRAAIQGSVAEHVLAATDVSLVVVKATVRGA